MLYDCRIRIRSDGDHFFEIQALSGRNSGAMTITGFDNNDKIRRANRANEWPNIVSLQRNLYEIYTDQTMAHVATIHTSEDLQSMAQGSRPGSDQISTFASYGA